MITARSGSVGKNKSAVKKAENKQKRIYRDLQRVRKTLADLQSSKLIGDYSGDDKDFDFVQGKTQSPEMRKEYLSGLLGRVEVDLDKETNAHIIPCISNLIWSKME